jgi:hypothetical protein
MTDAFIEARRAALERYLNRLAAHPAACRSEVRESASARLEPYVINDCTALHCGRCTVRLLCPGAHCIAVSGLPCSDCSYA